MDSDFEEEISIDDDSRNVPHHMETSSGSENSGDEKEVGPEDSMWQTGSNRNVSAAKSTTCAGNSKYYIQFHPLGIAEAILHKSSFADTH
jgi:hypothetical protein